jgi:mannosyltransferase OCH1-like enzyme
MMKLVQYWDTGTPPDDVAGCIESFKILNPTLNHRLFDQDTASWFIKKYIGKRELRAFEACAVPAMQADYFRLCALVAEGGVYADADFRCLSPLNDLLSKAGSALVFFWKAQMIQGFLMVRRRENPFFRACLNLTTENIEERRFRNVYLATGPAVMNAIRTAVEPSWPSQPEAPWPHRDKLKVFARASITDGAEVLSAVRALTLVNYLAVDRWISTPEAAYKATSTHWRSWPGSIYREAPTRSQAPASQER